MIRRPAAFINSIMEEGDKAEAIKYLQETWNELVNLEIALVRLGFTRTQLEIMKKEATLGKVF